MQLNLSKIYSDFRTMITFGCYSHQDYGDYSYFIFEVQNHNCGSPTVKEKDPSKFIRRKARIVYLTRVRAEQNRQEFSKNEDTLSKTISGNCVNH